MIEGSQISLTVESLKASHISKLASNVEPRQLTWLQTLLIRSWLAGAEKELPIIFPATQPSCLLAIEEDSPIAFLVVRPYNRRGTCWSISLPEFLKEPSHCGVQIVRRNIIQKAISYVSNRAHSWILRCPANDSDQLAISRELGFQPLKILNSWTPPIKIKPDIDNSPSIIKNTDIEWQKIKRNNAPLLLHLEKASSSVHLRQILDRQWRDLLNPNDPLSGVLISKKEYGMTAIAGIVNHSISTEIKTIELIRDIAWDSRLAIYLPIVLDNILHISRNINLETEREDKHLENLLNKSNWKLNSEIVLLGKSIWGRKNNSKYLLNKGSLENMLERLHPQRRPLPTPSVGSNLMK